MVSFLFYVSEDTAHEVINFNRKIPAGGGLQGFLQIMIIMILLFKEKLNIVGFNQRIIIKFIPYLDNICNIALQCA